MFSWIWFIRYIFSKFSPEFDFSLQARDHCSRISIPGATGILLTFRTYVATSGTRDVADCQRLHNRATQTQRTSAASKLSREFLYRRQAADAQGVAILTPPVLSLSKTHYLRFKCDQEPDRECRRCNILDIWFGHNAQKLKGACAEARKRKATSNCFGLSGWDFPTVCLTLVTDKVIGADGILTFLSPFKAQSLFSRSLFSFFFLFHSDSKHKAAGAAAAAEDDVVVFP